MSLTDLFVMAIGAVAIVLAAVFVGVIATVLIWDRLNHK